MRSAFDFAPYRRSTVGFDRLFDMLENSNPGQAQENYPPFDLIKLGDNDYRIELAVAGFKPDEIDITAQQNVLIVTGRKDEESERQRQRLHLPRHCDPLVRAALRARRPYPGPRRGPEGRPAGDRAGARNPRGDEAAEDQHRRILKGDRNSPQSTAATNLPPSRL